VSYILKVGADCLFCIPVPTLGNFTTVRYNLLWNTIAKMMRLFQKFQFPYNVHCNGQGVQLFEFPLKKKGTYSGGHPFTEWVVYNSTSHYCGECFLLSQCLR
jgi:hypothetical protein